MLAVKGVCTLCKEELSIFETGLVCCYCEKFFHGNCLNPPLDMMALENYVIAYSKWYCERCQGRSNAAVMSRTQDDRIDVEKKMDLLNQVRELITKIEESVQKLSHECDQMNQRAVELTTENADLKKHINLHIHYLKEKPKTFQEWKECRKKLQVGKREKGGIKYWIPLETDGAAPKKNLQKFVKKRHGLTDQEGRKSFVRVAKVRTFKHKAPDSSLTYRIYQSITHLSRNRLANIFLILILIMYTLVGAVVYTYVEGNYEMDLREQIIQERTRFKVDGNQTKEVVQNYFDFVYEIFKLHPGVLTRGDNELAWDFVDSIYFCGMTFTTVGYGDITPITGLGKLFTIVYAFFGIPMFLLLLASLGNYLCKGILFDISLMTRCCLKFCFKDSKMVKKLKEVEAYEDDTKAIVDQGFGVLMYFVVTLTVVFLIGTLLFMIGERLSFITSLYFTYITLSTLGFGDTVPNNRPFMIGSVVYIVIGLTLMSTGINAITYVLTKKITTGVEKLGQKIDDMDGNKDDSP